MCFANSTNTLRSWSVVHELHNPLLRPLVLKMPSDYLLAYSYFGPSGFEFRSPITCHCLSRLYASFRPRDTVEELLYSDSVLYYSSKKIEVIVFSDVYDWLKIKRCLRGKHKRRRGTTSLTFNPKWNRSDKFAIKFLTKISINEIGIGIISQNINLQNLSARHTLVCLILIFYLKNILFHKNQRVDWTQRNSLFNLLQNS